MVDKFIALSPGACQSTLLQRLAEPAPAHIQLVTGPRQVGKTTVLLHVARALGERALYFAADSPEAVLPGAWEEAWRAASDRAVRCGTAALLVDEAHLVPDWARRLKG